MTVNTDNVRDIDATSLARGWNAIQIEERFKAVKSRLHRACVEASPSAINEARRFSVFFPLGLLIRQLHCRNSCICRALPAIILELHFRTER